MFCLLLSGVKVYGQNENTAADLAKEARQAGIDDELLISLTDRAEQTGMDNESLTTIIGSALALTEQQLPSETVLSKALEGISKGVSGAELSSAAREIRNSIEQAAPVVDRWASQNEIEHFTSPATDEAAALSYRSDLVQEIARGLRSGVEEDLFASLLDEFSTDEQLHSEAEAGNIIAVVRVIPELPVESAEQAELSRSFVVRALQSGVPPREMQKMPAAMNRSQEGNRLVATAVLSELFVHHEIGTPGESILQNLLQGQRDIPNPPVQLSRNPVSGNLNIP